ncbi:MAG: hypothetical protein EHM47_04910 [Ignavibacteriales bacterium]|nr:MAG: hypothetical protein EHM47_04910 [Ignavibacteriales bacterium]
MKITSKNIKAAFSETSSYYLIVMNFFPVAGVLLWNWDPVSVVYFYIAETIVIGILNFFKILISQTNLADKAGRKLQIPFFGKLFIGIFFLIHFNAFNYGQIELFTSFSGRSSGSFGSFLNYFLTDDVLSIALLTIIISHIFSFYTDFIKGKQYEYVPPFIFMFLPYPRIFVQQFVGVFGVFFVMIFNLPLMFLILLQIFKTLAELFSHTFINEKLENLIKTKRDSKEQKKITDQLLIKKSLFINKL